jgi:hypothetical protein
MQSAFALLQTYLTGGATPRLLVADENIDASDIASAATGTQVLSNQPLSPSEVQQGLCVALPSEPRSARSG